MTRSETGQVLRQLAANWPGIEITEPTARLWAEQCADVDRSHAQQAVRRIIRSDERFPSVSRFVKETQAVAGTVGKSFWRAATGCQYCHGTGLVTDDHSQEWLCSCNSLEFKTAPQTGRTRPPEWLIRAARDALPKPKEAE